MPRLGNVMTAATVSRDRCVAILAAHGWRPDESTAYDADRGEMLAGTSFDEMIGYAEFYDVETIRMWLGY